MPNVEQTNDIYEKFIWLNLVTNFHALQNRIYIEILPEKLLLYEMYNEAVFQKLKTIFNENFVGNLKSEQKYIPILISNKMYKTNETIQNRNTKKGDFVSLNQLIEITNKQDYKSYFQSKEGAYIPFNFSEKDIKKKQESIKSIISKSHGLNVSFSESFLKSVNNARIIIDFGSGYCVVIFFILVAQFKSHIQPFIVMLTITFGITGALFTLWLFNDSLNIMSIIGLVVLIGILDNYYIMKIDTMNRSVNSNRIIETIKSSCEKRLKSQIMIILTTIFGGCPYLISVDVVQNYKSPSPCRSLAECAWVYLFHSVLYL